MTKRLIEETIRANEGENVGAWNPLPDGYAPENAVATKNLLGYSALQKRLGRTALHNLKIFEFPSANARGLNARLCYSNQNDYVLHSFMPKQYKLEMCLGKIDYNETADVATLGYLRVSERTDNHRSL